MSPSDMSSSGGFGVGAWALLLSLAACSLPQSAPASEHRAQSLEQAIVGGEEDLLHPAVVALVERRDDCDPGEQLPPVFCSGVLISETEVLTAAHCFSSDDPLQLTVFFGRDVQLDGAWLNVRHIALHPEFVDADKANDLALITLEREAPVAPMALQSAPLDMSLVGSQVTLVGFGYAEPDEARSVGIRRSGTALVDELDAETFRVVPDSAMSCLVDSGGPVLLGSGQDAVVIGITSQGDLDCAVYGRNVRVDAYNDSFIAAALGSAPEQPSRQPIDPQQDYCAAGCTQDSDCPEAMRCVAGGEGRSCAYITYGPGSFGDACSSDADCGQAGICLRAATDGAMCRCYIGCGAEPQPPADMTEEGSGCSTARAPAGDDGWAWCLLLVCAAWRRRAARAG